VVFFVLGLFRFVIFDARGPRLAQKGRRNDVAFRHFDARGTRLVQKGRRNDGRFSSSLTESAVYLKLWQSRYSTGKL
jgi:hypothetical protein